MVRPCWGKAYCTIGYINGASAVILATPALVQPKTVWAEDADPKQNCSVFIKPVENIRPAH